MYSDGLLTRWSLSQYPGLINRPAAVIAAVLLRDFRRSRDDSSVFVLRPGDHHLEQDDYYRFIAE